MNRIVLKNVFIFTLLICSFFVKDLFADSNIKVAIFPFSIYASQSDDRINDQIKTKMPLMLLEKLEQEGAKVIFVKEKINNELLDYSYFREQGIKWGVDYLIIGFIFIDGQSISIDIKMINIYEKDTFITFYSEADNIKNFIPPVSKISKEIIGEIFHKNVIIDIAVTGNKRIEKDVVLRTINTQIGDIIRDDNISADIRKIYEMGYFDNIIVQKKSFANGVKLIFELTEKSIVRKLKFRNNTVFEMEELANIINTRTGVILNIHKLKSDVNRMRLMYTEKNYHNCLITYEIIPIDNSQADIIFKFDEGKKLKVKKITFEGNKYFTDDDIKSSIQTAEKGLFSFITTSGDLNETEVKNDVIRIESLYKNNGFIDAKVSDPIIDIGEKSISICFKIYEGAQYKIKEINITGDLILPKLSILELVNVKEGKLYTKEGELYNRKSVRNDIMIIANAYSNKGFANVNIRPMVIRDDKEHMMAITYSIDKGKAVYFNRINISGNSKTRDKVIRREIKTIEQGLFRKKDIQRSYRNLKRLDYFADVNVEPSKTSDKNKMNLNVKVIEKQTGNLAFGGGYSSDEGAFLTSSIEERNLFGRGQNLKLSAKIASEDILYNINFFEPYFLDTNFSGGFDIYKNDKEFDYYDKEVLGLRLKLGYRLFDYTRVGVHYNIEDFDIANIQTDSTNMIAGSFRTSSIKSFIDYDSRDASFLATQGSNHKFSIEYSGGFLGGDIDYTKYIVETGVFFPIFWKFTGALHAEGGYVEDRTGSNVDIDDIKFYLGGINSIRGFDKYDISANDEGDIKNRGGEKYVQLNAEITFPFAEKFNVAGVFFYDRGDVYEKSGAIDFGDQYSSFGTGVRWNSPMGPLRLEYSWIIEGKHVKESGKGQFEFAFGAFF